MSFPSIRWRIALVALIVAAGSFQSPNGHDGGQPLSPEASCAARPIARQAGARLLSETDRLLGVILLATRWSQRGSDAHGA